MYRTAYQRGMLTIFFSVGSKPLEIWDVYAKDGYVSRFLDQDIKSMVLEIRGNNVSTTYMTCPNKNRTLGISMPFLVMIVKNLKKYFSFEVTILDETNTRRRFRVSNFQSSTQILPLCTAMPIGLSDGWNQIQFNLAEFTRRAYKKQFVEVQKLKINANIRLRRIYFTERLVPEDELPPEYKLFFPLPSKGAKGKKDENEDKRLSTSQAVAPPVENILSKTDVVKPPSKTSIHSLKKSQSRAGSQAKIVEVKEGAESEAARAGEAAPIEGAGEATAAGEETSAASEATPVEGEVPGEATPAVGEVVGEGETAAEQTAVEEPAAAAAEGEVEAPPPAEIPADVPAEEASAPTE